MNLVLVGLCASLVALAWMRNHSEFFDERNWFGLSSIPPAYSSFSTAPGRTAMELGIGYSLPQVCYLSKTYILRIQRMPGEREPVYIADFQAQCDSSAIDLCSQAIHMYSGIIPTRGQGTRCGGTAWNWVDYMQYPLFSLSLFWSQASFFEHSSKIPIIFILC